MIIGAETETLGTLAGKCEMLEDSRWDIEEAGGCWRVGSGTARVGLVIRDFRIGSCCRAALLFFPVCSLQSVCSTQHAVRVNHQTSSHHLASNSRRLSSPHLVQNHLRTPREGADCADNAYAAEQSTRRRWKWK